MRPSARLLAPVLTGWGTHQENGDTCRERRPAAVNLPERESDQGRPASRNGLVDLPGSDPHQDADDESATTSDT